MNRTADAVTRNRSGLWILLLLFFSLSVLILIGDRAPIHLKARFHEVALEGEFYYYYNGVVDGSIIGPFVYRVLVPFTIHTLQSFLPFAEPIVVDAILKLCILTGLQLALFVYFRIFLGVMASLAGVFLFDALTGYSLTYIAGPSLIETGDLLNAAIFVGILYGAYHRNHLLMVVLFALGAANRETVLAALVPVVAILWNERRRPVIFSAIAGAAVIPYLAIRLMRARGGEFDWFSFEGLARNIPGLGTGDLGNALAGNVHVFFLLVPLFVLVLWKMRQLPVFLRRTLWLVPVLVIIHYLVGSIIEARLWLPALVALIPPALLNLEQILNTERT